MFFKNKMRSAEFKEYAWDQLKKGRGSNIHNIMLNKLDKSNKVWYNIYTLEQTQEKMQKKINF